MYLRQTSIGTLLDRTRQAFGENCWSAPAEGHALKTSALCEPLKDAVVDLCILAKKLLRTRVDEELAISLGHFLEPGPVLCQVRLAERNAANPVLYLEVTLRGHDHHIPESLQLELHIGYQHIKTYRWLVAQWRRPLSLMMQPLKLDLWENGISLSLPGATKQPYRGKDILRRVESYLERSDGDRDQCFAFGVDIFRNTPEQEAALAMAIFLALQNALTKILTKRADPDCLLTHFLNLRPHLPRLPFRASAAFPEFLPPSRGKGAAGTVNDFLG